MSQPHSETKHSADAPGIASWCGQWCNSAESLLRDWQGWIDAVQDGAIDAVGFAQAVQRGQPLLRRLQQLMADRREFLAARGSDSLQSIVAIASAGREISARLTAVQAGLRGLRREAAAQWIACSQLARSVDEVLFIVRSGNSRPATYSTDELAAFQGGFVLDSQA